MLSLESIKNIIKQQGLVYLGLTGLGPEPRYLDFAKWLASKKHGGMSFLENYLPLRQDPQKLLPEAKVAIILGFPYYQGDRYDFRKTQKPLIAQYARLQDYHKLFKNKCQTILTDLLELLPQAEKATGRVMVDTAPLLERALAQRSGVGFVGKNTMFIHPEWGSYLLLGEIFLSCELPRADDSKVQDSGLQSQSKKTACGSCRRCEVHCPTGALSDYSLDATKCLAYYTIEHRGTIPVQYWSYLANYVFGCDICQLVCPVNRNVPISKQWVVKINDFPPLFEVASMDQAYYERVFGGTPLTRAKRSGLRRNALIAMVVKEDDRMTEILELISQEAEPLLIQTLDQIDEYKKFKTLSLTKGNSL